MTNIQESKLSMIDVLFILLDQNAATTALLPGFNALYTQLKENILGITGLSEQQEMNKTGVRDFKEILRYELSEKAYEISHKTEVYAKLTNKVILAKEVHYSLSSLTKASDAKLESRAMIINDKAKENIAALEDYGIIPDDLVALQESIDMFHNAIPTPRNSKTEKKQITIQLAKLFKENDEILAKMDLLVEIVRLTKPIFYQGYRDSRKIVNTALGTLALMGSALDAATGEGLNQTKFTFVRQQEDLMRKGTVAGELLEKTTSKKGNFNLKTMEDGTYVVTIEKTGFKTQVITINKSAGDRIKLVVKMEKI